MGFGVSLGISASELLDGTLKLRHCTTLFTTRFLPWSLPRVGNGGSKWKDVTPGHLGDAGGNTGERVRLTRKTCPSLLAPPLPPKEWGVRWACLAIFFLGLGLGDVGHWGRLEPVFGGNRGRRFRLVSPAEGASALALAHFNEVHTCACMDRHACTTHRPYHHHHLRSHFGSRAISVHASVVTVEITRLGGTLAVCCFRESQIWCRHWIWTLSLSRWMPRVFC